MRIPYIDYVFSTERLSIRDIALLFRDGLTARPAGLVGFVASKGLEWEFFTPTRDSDPFARLTEDQPDFEVAATYGIRGVANMGTHFGKMIDASSGGVAQLSVWERGHRREARVRHAGDLSKGSKKIVGAMLASIEATDSAIRIAESRGQL